MTDGEQPAAEVLVVLSVRPALEEPVVDWLLAWGGGLDFSRVDVAEHSASHEHLNTAEQVLGRQQRLQFQLRLPATETDALLTSARDRFGGADVHYWILPVLGSGILRRSEETGEEDPHGR